MSQILIVTGDSEQDAREFFAQASAIQSRLSGLHPTESIASPHLCVATWPSDNGQAPVLEHRDNAWRVGAGAWTGPKTPPPLDSGESLQGYNGVFVFATGSQSDGAVQVATDPIGSLHVYIIRCGGSTIISTSSLVLASVGRVDWDPNGIREFLAKGTVFGMRTLHKSVDKLLPGRIMEFRGAFRTREQVYWAPTYSGYLERDKKKIVKEYAGILTDAIGSTLKQAGQPILDLTGGFDSRLLLAAALQHRSATELNCTVSGESSAKDVISASGIAKVLGLHLERRPPQIPDVPDWWQGALEALAYTDGEASVLEYANTLSVHRAGMARFDASINGSGGEVIRGRWWEPLWPHTGALNYFDVQRVATVRFAHDPWAEALLSEMYEDTLTQHFAGVLEAELQGLNGWPNTALMDRVYLRLRMQRWQGRLASATNRIWPCFQPFLFRPVIDLAFNVPFDLRRKSRIARAVLQQLNPRLAAAPMADGTPATPVRMSDIWRHLPRYRTFAKRAARKLRITHTGAHTAEQRLSTLMQLAPVREILNPATMLTRTLYRQDALQEFLQQALAGKVDYRRLGRILSLELAAQTIAEHADLSHPPSA